MRAVAAVGQVVRARTTTALAHVTGPPLPADTEFFWSQGLLDVLFEYPIESDRSEFSIDPRLARLGLRVVTVLRFLPPGGAVRAFEFRRLRARPARSALASGGAAVRQLGFFHILDGTDHLLFLLLPGHSVPALPRAGRWS